MNEERLKEGLIHDYGHSDVAFEPCYANAHVYDATLVLEGGSMRSLFTAGVLDTFLAHGIAFEEVVGVSAGALMGYNYVAGLMGRGAYINMKYCADKRYLSFWAYAHTGNMFDRPMSFDVIPHDLDPFPFEAFNESPMHLTAVATDLASGKAVYLPLRDAEADLAALVATSSLPLVSQPVAIGDRQLLDGGTSDSVPLHWAQANGATKIVVVCTNPHDYVRKPNPLQGFISMAYRAYPAYVHRCAVRHEEYNATYRQLEALHDQGRIFTIWPLEVPAVRSDEHDPERLLALYERGVMVAEQSLGALEAYLDPTDA